MGHRADQEKYKLRRHDPVENKSLVRFSAWGCLGLAMVCLHLGQAREEGEARLGSDEVTVWGHGREQRKAWGRSSTEGVSPSQRFRQLHGGQAINGHFKMSKDGGKEDTIKE